MPDEKTIRDVIGLLGPGFVALKIFQLFGAQRARSQWEWTIWSILASLPIAAVAAWLIPMLPGWIQLDPVAKEVIVRFIAAAAFGALAVAAWRWAASSRRSWVRNIQHRVTNSAWDATLEDALLFNRPVSFRMKNGAGYRGHIRFGGREDTGAEGWLYLTSPSLAPVGDSAWEERPDIHGVLVRREDVEHVRIYPGPKDDAPIDEPGAGLSAP